MYALQQALRAIRHNWIASTSTLSTMLLSLTMLAGFSLLSLNLSLFLSQLQSELDIAAYISPNMDASRIKKQVDAWNEVAASALVSPDEALHNLVNDFSYLEQVVSADVIDNPLPTTLDVRLVDPSHASIVSSRLSQLPGVQDVEDGSEAMRAFIALRDALRLVGACLIVVLLSATFFAMVNAIRAAIVSRHDEIEVMHLVGATRNFIRAPFLLEGFILGLLGGILGIALVMVTYQVAIAQLAERIPLIPFLDDPILLSWISLLLLLLAVLVGLGGSAVSVSYYLEEIS